MSETIVACIITLITMRQILIDIRESNEQTN